MISPSANINKTHAKKRVLIAPLDWGLGHTTRCIPVIQEFLAQGFEVILAAEKAGKSLLEKEFPALLILPLPGYRISYGKKRQFFFTKMLLQVPKIKAAIRAEKNWLKKMITAYNIDIVVSDNRFGLYNEKIRCIFITHQLFIKTGKVLTGRIAQKINYQYISRFQECWVPDAEGGEGLAGELSHPKKMPAIPVRYIGFLSRFASAAAEKKYAVVALLSGPEPQRTLFEKKLTAQMAGLGQTGVLVRGLPADTGNITTEHISINHLPAAELNKLLAAADIIVARSGYSTVMDLAALQKNAVLVPTPGQAEQEYLAAYLSEKKYCITQSQEAFNLSQASKLFLENDLKPFPRINNNDLKLAVSSLL